MQAHTGAGIVAQPVPDQSFPLCVYRVFHRNCSFVVRRWCAAREKAYAGRSRPRQLLQGGTEGRCIFGVSHLNVPQPAGLLVCGALAAEHGELGLHWPQARRPEPVRHWRCGRAAYRVW